MSVVRSSARATSPLQMSWPSNAKANFPPVMRESVRLTIVSQPYSAPTTARANAAASARSSSDATMRTTVYCVGS